MKKKIVFNIMLLCFGLMLTSFSGNFNRKPEATEYNSFNLIYVDNSKLTTDDGLSSGMLAAIEAKRDSMTALQNSKCCLYISDGQKPKYGADVKKWDDMIKSLYLGHTNAPIMKIDLPNLNNSVLGSPFGIKNSISCSYFLTDNTLVSLNRKGMEELTSLFVRKIALLSDFKGHNMDVYIYYGNLTNKLNADELHKRFAFYAGTMLNPVIKYHLVKL